MTDHSNPPLTSPASLRLFGVNASAFSRIAADQRTWMKPPPPSPSEQRVSIVDAVRQRDAATLATLLQPGQSDIFSPSRTKGDIGLFGLCLENFDPACANLLLHRLSPADVARTNIDDALGGQRGFCTRPSGPVHAWLRATLPTLKSLWAGQPADPEGLFLLSLCRHAFALRGDQPLQSDRCQTAQVSLLDVFEAAATRFDEIGSQASASDMLRTFHANAEHAEQVVAMAVTLGDFDRAARLLSSSDAVERYVFALHRSPAMFAADHLAGLLRFLDSPAAATIATQFEAANIKRTASPDRPDGTPLLWTVFENASFGPLLLDHRGAAAALAEILMRTPFRMHRLFAPAPGRPPAHHFDRLATFVVTHAAQLTGLADSTGETAAHFLARQVPQADPWTSKADLATRFFEAALALGGVSVFSAISGFGQTPIQLLPVDLRPAVSRLVLAAVAAQEQVTAPRTARTL